MPGSFPCRRVFTPWQLPRYHAGMGTQDLIFNFVQSCVSGRLGMSDCGPIWQLGVIAVFLLAAIATLLVLRLRSGSSPAKA